MQPAPAGPSLVVTGRVIKPYGVRGWVKIEVLSLNPLRFQPGNSFILEGKEGGERLVVEEKQVAGDALLVRFRGMENRGQAGEIAGRRLLVKPEEIGEAPEDAFWEHQLMGMEVRTREGKCLGKVMEIMETGANDVLVVQGERESLIPMTGEVVKEIDLDGGTILIEPLPGLLED
ncbi:MAG: 16S rRNA processing protein RimM [Actinobacteria bacterium]|nr:16S rRNA processing protein RimM [Actinomycetota bacterium]